MLDRGVKHLSGVNCAAISAVGSMFSMSACGTKPTFIDYRIQVRLPALNRRSGLNVASGTVLTIRKEGALTGSDNKA